MSSGPAPLQYRTVSTSSRLRDDALGEQKPLGQFDIGPRRAHGDGDGSAVDADLQRLLDHQGFGSGDRIVCGHVLRAAPGRDPPH